MTPSMSCTSAKRSSALEHLAEQLLGLVELALLVVLAPEEQELLDALVHGVSRNVNPQRRACRGIFEYARRVDRRTLLAVALGTSAIACVATPFAVVGQRHAPKPLAPRPVLHTIAPGEATVAVETPASPPENTPPKHYEHTFRVHDLASDPHVTVVSGTIGKHVFLTALSASGLAPKECRRVLAGLSGSRKLDGLNLNRLAPDDAFQYAKAADGHVIAFELVPSARSADSLELFQEHESAPNEHLEGKHVSIPIERKTIHAAIVIGDDLHASLAAAGLRENAATLLDDALDGHADLSDLRSGARLRLVVTEQRIEGEFAGYAPIDAVELTPPPRETAKSAVRVYHFASHHGRAAFQGYFDAQGRQPYHGGWRSPVPMARISSRFNPHRMHPVLHVVMPHNGVDFAAAPGTPVYARQRASSAASATAARAGTWCRSTHPRRLHQRVLPPLALRGGPSTPASTSRRASSSATSARPAVRPAPTSTSPSSAGPRRASRSSSTRCR